MSRFPNTKVPRLLKGRLRAETDIQLLYCFSIFEGSDCNKKRLIEGLLLKAPSYAAKI